MIKYQWVDNELKEIEPRMQGCTCCYKTPEEAMYQKLSMYQNILNNKIYDLQQWMQKIKPLQEAMIQSNMTEDMNDVLSVEYVNEIQDILQKLSAGANVYK